MCAWGSQLGHLGLSVGLLYLSKESRAARQKSDANHTKSPQESFGGRMQGRGIEVLCSQSKNFLKLFLFFAEIVTQNSASVEQRA
jgi:hypothetical protein